MAAGSTDGNGTGSQDMARRVGLALAETPTGPPEALQAFLTAWRQWASKPGGLREAEAMEAASKAFAAYVGLPTRSLRDIATSFHRAGFTYRQTANAILLVMRAKWEL